MFLINDVCRTPTVGDTERLTSEQVLVPSTDYRDLRKAAFQQYAVAADFNAVKLPPSVSAETGSTVGVAFVAAALALGVCLGLEFSSVLDGPDLLRTVRQLKDHHLPLDIETECRSGISEDERARAGDWIAIWGGWCPL